ncbi:MAG: TIM barrel protein [Mariniphaga sp.]
MQTRLFKLFAIAIIIAVPYACNRNIPGMDDLYAWCIVPFDNQNRTPEERMEMLKNLGFKAYAYDWREEHLSEMTKELQLAVENDIAVQAVWMWLDNSDAVGKLSKNNQSVLQSLEESGIHTQIWVSFPENHFDAFPDSLKVQKAKEMIGYVSREAEKQGCKIGLYNHGGWFGDPDHLVEIIRSLPDQEIGIIFNFHHAHEWIEDFSGKVKKMTPFLWAVNLNGMNSEGPKILPLGEGSREKEMIDILEKNGFHGPYGILGHIPDADVKLILQENLNGLKTIF